MILSLIVAMANNRVIGKNNQLPWRLPADLQNFKKVTMGKPVIMGRKTFESIGRPLPGRKNIIITSNPAYVSTGCEIVNSLDQALDLARQEPEAMIIGGAEIYRLALPMVQRMYVTLIHEDIEGDTRFADYNRDEWLVSDRSDHTPDEDNPHQYSFLVLERKRGTISH
ncbi:MAG: type 3 dihydrofolate reductase [Gammaproteobacteria bacterium]